MRKLLRLLALGTAALIVSSNLASAAGLLFSQFTSTTYAPATDFAVGYRVGSPNINIQFPLGALALGGVDGTTITDSANVVALNLANANTWTAPITSSYAGTASTPAVKLTGVPFAGTATTSFPLLYIDDSNATASTTLNTAGAYFGINGHGTADLANLMLDGVSKIKITSAGIVTGPGQSLLGGISGVQTNAIYINNFDFAIGGTSSVSFGIETDSTGLADSVIMNNAQLLSWSSLATGSTLQNLRSNIDTIITRKGAANPQFGAADAAAPVAQTLSVQSVVAGTSNTVGANFTINASQGTGTGNGGNIVFKLAPAGTTGTSQNALSSTLTIDTTGHIPKRTVTAADAVSITPNTDSADITYQSNSQALGTLTINADGGIPTNGRPWLLKIKSTNVQTFSWNSQFVGGANPLPTATSGGGLIDNYSFIYDSVNSKWEYTGGAGGF